MPKHRKRRIMLSIVRFGGPGIPPAGGSDLCDAVAKTSGGSRRYDRGTRE